MSWKHLVTSMAVLALAATLSGCSTSPTRPSNLQSPEVPLAAATVAASGPLVDDGLSGTEPQALTSPQAGAASVTATIHPVWFWRTIVTDVPSYSFAFSDTDSTGRPRQAIVTVQRHLLGFFNVVPGTTADSTVADTAHAIHKPLDDTWTRRLLLRRVKNPADSTQTFWRVAAVSGADVLTHGGVTRIQSVRVQATGVDTTITDPLAFHWLRRVLRFAPADSVHLTVTTARDDDVVLLHHRDHRVRFANHGDGTYSFAFVSGPFPGWRSFEVDAISRGSIFDDTAPYDSNHWHLPFVISSEAAVDFYP